VEHEFARKQCLEVYGKAVKGRKKFMAEGHKIIELIILITAVRDKNIY